MKRLIIIPFMLLAMLPASAQKISIANATVNAGRTGFMQPITATFELSNKSKRKLLIESVKEVRGNEKFTIKMTYDAKMLRRFQKMVAVKSNGSEKPLYLTMKGHVLADLEDFTGKYPIVWGDLLLDKADLEYDDVNKGDHPVQEIHILNNGEKTMIPNVMHLPPYLTALVTPEKLEPLKAGTIAITLNSEKLRDFGLNQTSVYIAQQLGEKVSQDNEVPVSAVLLPDLKDYDNVSKALAPQLQISTTDVDFTDFGGKSKKTAEIFLVNTGKTTLEIRSMQMFTRGLKLTLSSTRLEPSQTATMKITGIASDLQKVRTKPRILMITNDPDHAKMIINIKVNSEK